MTTPAFTTQIRPEITTLISEFLLQQQTSTTLKLLKTLNFPHSIQNLRLKSTIMLQSIQDIISYASITETLLDYLEDLEVTELVRSAYISVAVECTAKYLISGGEVGKSKYVDAVQRIWRERIGKLEAKGSDLVCDELRKERKLIEGAVSDESVVKWFVERNTRNEALRKVRVCVDEVKRGLGDSILEMASNLELEGKQNERGNLANVSEEPASRPPALSRNREEEEVGREEGNGGTGNGGLIGDIANDSVEDSDVVADASRNQGVVDGNRKSKEVHKGNAQIENICSFRHHRGPVRIADSDGIDLNIVYDEYNGHTDPEASNEGPLMERPDKNDKGSSGTYDTRDTDMGEKHSAQTSPEHEEEAKSLAMGKDDVDPLNPLLNPSKEHPQNNAANVAKDASPRNPSVDPSVKVPQSKSDVETSSGQPNVHPRRSLMDRNSTARTFEWSESSDVSPEPSSSKNMPRNRVVSIKRESASPLRKNEPTKRRKTKRWTPQEEDALREGVKEYGEGYWKCILKSRRDIFEERTEVDLKDKWRNLMK